MADKPIKTLLVEDNPGDARLIQRMLEDRGKLFEITHVTNLAQGLEFLRKSAFDVVLLDLGLPDSSGLETLARTRAQAPNVPIIVITGLSDRETAVLALNQGANDFIAKESVDGSLLARAILRSTAPTP